MSAMHSTLFRPTVMRRPCEYLWRLFVVWARDIAHYFARRAALKRLREFNDRELRDIGLTRGQAEAAVRGYMPRPDRTRM